MGDWRKHATPLARGHKPIRVKPPSAKGKGAKHKKLKLREYQEETVRFAEKHDFRYGLFDAPGVGKTAPSLVSIDRHRAKLTPALCVVPASVQRNWKREAEMWCKGLRAVLAPPGDEPIPRGADIVVCTWTAAYRKLNQLQKYKFKYMIVDEAHYGKSPVAQRSRAVASLAKMIPHVVLLSGTPFTNTAEDLDVLRRLLGTETPPELRRLLEEVAPDVPPKRRVQVPVELDPATRRKYDAVEEDFKKWLEDQGNLTIEDMFGVDENGNPRKMTAEGLIKIGYLRRLAGQGKIEAAVRWISDAVRSGEPCVVFADHKHVLDGIAKGMKRIRVTYERIDGGTSKKNRQAAVDRFQHGVTPVIICSKAAKEGITLTRARHLLFAERWWTAADEEQAEDRISRLGQRFPTTMWYLMGVNTIDTRVDQIVGNKREEARKRIGVATAATVPLDKVRAVMRKGEPTAEQLATAATGDLPRLPKPTTVLRLCFHPKRWTRDEAVRWATMKGYRPRKSYTDDCSRIVLEIGERRDFHKGTYKRQNLSVDIFAVVAKRKTQAQRRRSTLGRRRRKKQPPKSVRIRREIAALRREARRLRNS